MESQLTWQEFIITRVIKACGYSAIVFVALIFYFLLREGLPTLAEVPLGNLFSTRWYPIEEYYGILPLITGSLVVTSEMKMAVPRPNGTATSAAPNVTTSEPVISGRMP